MKKFLIGVGIIAVIILAIVLAFGGIYNSLVQGEEKVSESWAQVENVYQRRLDLIPNLVETVKGYAAHEEGTFQASARRIEKSSKDSPSRLGKVTTII